MQDTLKLCFLVTATVTTLFAFSQTGYHPQPPAESLTSEENLIRLHVVANSDKPADQELKLKVRDAVDACLENNLLAAQDAESAREVVRENLALIEEVARREVKAAGRDYPVKAEMGTFAFPHKNYGSFILPAGDYEAVRVVIGSGRGANWWCVLFPPLCFITSTSNLDAVPSASTGPSPTAVEAGYLNNPTAVEIGPNGCQGSLKYEFRFRSLELIEQLKENWSNKNKNT